MIYKTYTFTIKTIYGYTYSDKVRSASYGEAWNTIINDLSEAQKSELESMKLSLKPIQINTLPGYEKVSDDYIYDQESMRIRRLGSKRKALDTSFSCTTTDPFNPTYRVTMVKKNGKNSSYKLFKLMKALDIYNLD